MIKTVLESDSMDTSECPKLEEILSELKNKQNLFEDSTEIEICAKLKNQTVLSDSERNSQRQETIAGERVLEEMETGDKLKYLNVVPESQGNSQKQDNITFQKEMNIYEQDVHNSQQNFSIDSGMIGDDISNGSFISLMLIPDFEPVPSSVNAGENGHTPPDMPLNGDGNEDVQGNIEKVTDGNNCTDIVIMNDFEMVEPDETTTRCRFLLSEKLLINIAVPAFNTLLGVVVGLTYLLSSVSNVKKTGDGNYESTTESSLMQHNRTTISKTYVNIGDPSVALHLVLGASFGALVASVTMRSSGLLHVLRKNALVLLVGLLLQIINCNPTFKIFTLILCGSTLGYGTSTTFVWITENGGPMTHHQMFSLIPLFATIGMLSSYWMPLCVTLLVTTLCLCLLLACFEKVPLGLSEIHSPEHLMAIRGVQSISAIVEQPAQVVQNHVNTLLVALKPFIVPDFYKPVVIICAIEILQQLSGLVYTFFLAFKLFEEYSCQVDLKRYSFYATLSSVAAASIFCLCYNLFKSRFVFLISQGFAALFLFCVGACCMTMSDFGTKGMPEELRCVPGILACTTGAVSLTGALPLPIITCPQMLSKPYRAVGTGICIATTCLSLTLILSVAVYLPLFYTYGYHSVLLLLYAASFSCFFISTILLPEIDGMNTQLLKEYFIKGWLYYR